MHDHIFYFSSFLEKTQISNSEMDLNKYALDRTKIYKANASLILFPKSTTEVSLILKYCNDKHLAVVPSSGRTGLSGGAVAKDNEIVISLEKMNKILELDLSASLVVLEAGVILEELHHYLEKQGLMFPLDFAAKGSAMIGGCISTNAGGIKVIKYGMTRDLVLGLEVVLMSGEILDLNKKLIKDNSGYALQQLFIGSEGTLGIITKAVLKCVNFTQDYQLAILATHNFSDIINILISARESNLNMSSFEFLSEDAKNVVLKHSKQAIYPFDVSYEYLIVIELNDKSNDNLEKFIEKCADKGLIADAAVAQNSNDYKQFWALREHISESTSMMGQIHKNDIAVPVNRLKEFIPELENLIKNSYQEFQLILFGHIGDGNIHVNLIDKNKLNLDEFKTKTAELDKTMFSLIQKFEGSISAEHGIGLLKKEGLLFRRSPLEIELMRQIKKVFDPNLLLNPGKVI